MTVVHHALGLEHIEDALLMRIGPDLQPTDGEGFRRPVGQSAGDGQRLVEPLGVSLRVVPDERLVLPVRVERCGELGDQLGRVSAREADVPLEAVE